MKTYMPLNGLRWSRNSGSANCDMPQSVVFGRPGGGTQKNPFIEIPFPDDWHWIFLPSCSVSVKAVYSSFAI